MQRRDSAGRPLDPPPPWPPEVEVRHQWPPDLRPAAHGRLVLDQPWEFGAIPLAWVQAAAGPVEEMWAPSAFVADMFRAAGVPGERIGVVPPGIEPGHFAAAAAAAPAPGEREVRTFLFVGGAIARKGVDVLLDAWRAAFAATDPVRLVVKDVGVTGVYRGVDRGPIAEAVEDRAVAPIEHLTEDLSAQGVAALLASADVLVHPYRGEGFGMPVLEAMATARPVVVTAGGPTDEFCPPEAGWRVPAERRTFAREEVGGLPTAGRPWMLEPDRDALVALLREVAAAPGAELARRGAAAQHAARAWTWDAAATAAATRLEALAGTAPRARAPVALDAEGPGPWILAVPSFERDALVALVRAWAAVPEHGATLVVLADRAERWPDEAVGALAAAAAAAGVDLGACADIAVQAQPRDVAHDAAVVEACDAVLRGAPAPYARLAAALGRPVAGLEDALRVTPRSR